MIPSPEFHKRNHLRSLGGLIFSQILTLYTTPVVYLYFDRLREWWESRRRQAIRRAQTTAGLPDAV